VALLDLQMPALDGYGALERLRANPRFASPPIVALTASAMHGDQEKGLAAGFTSYISKPITLKVLRAEMGRLLP
jgi:CheY-like chemotaxis protein